MTKTEFLKSLPKRESIYVIFSRLTNLPYVECNEESFDDEAFLYTDERDGVEKAKELSADRQPAVVAKVEQKELLRLFTDFYVYGITCLAVSVGGDVLHIPLSEVVRRPGTPKLPENQRPLENPRLQLSMLYYLQEARKLDADLNTEHIGELEEEMAVNLMRAGYLIPVKEIEQDGRKLTQLLLVKNREGETLAPIFTDAVEFGRFKKDEGLKVGVTDFEKLANMPLPAEVTGYLLNPAGVGLVLTKEYMKKEWQLNH